MLKYVKHNLETIAGVEIYPIISLTIFFTAFVLFTVWAMTYSKETIKKVSNLILDKLILEPQEFYILIDHKRWNQLPLKVKQELTLIKSHKKRALYKYLEK